MLRTLKSGIGTIVSVSRLATTESDQLEIEVYGKVVFVPGTENFREAVIWLHKLFAEGLLSEEDYVGDSTIFRS